MAQKIERAVLILMAIVSVIIALADFVGVLDSVTWLSEKIPSLLLVFLAIIAGYLGAERRGKLEKIDDAIAELANDITTLENRYSQINAFLNMMGQSDPYEWLGLAYNLQSIGEFRSEKMIAVDKEHVLKFWRDCVGASTHWFTTSYIRPETAWDTGWGDAYARAVQHERIATGGKISRVFIVDDESEYESLRQVMEGQKGIGVQVRWILKDELLRNKTVAKYVRDLGTLDVSVADGSWVFRNYLDRNRNSIRMTGVRDAQLLEKANFILNHAFNRGKSLTTFPDSESG